MPILIHPNNVAITPNILQSNLNIGIVVRQYIHKRAAQSRAVLTTVNVATVEELVIMYLPMLINVTRKG